MNAANRSLSPVPAVPVDLAEWLGAVQLTRLALEAVQAAEPPVVNFHAYPDARAYSLRALLTTVIYALARGHQDSEEIARRVHTEPDLRYLCAHNPPDALAVRLLRRRHLPLVHDALTRLIARALAEAPQPEARALAESCDPRLEASLRLEAAMAADSLALDF